MLFNIVTNIKTNRLQHETLIWSSWNAIMNSLINLVVHIQNFTQILWLIDKYDDSFYIDMVFFNFILTFRIFINFIFSFVLFNIISSSHFLVMFFPIIYCFKYRFFFPFFSPSLFSVFTLSLFVINSFFHFLAFFLYRFLCFEFLFFKNLFFT